MSNPGVSNLTGEREYLFERGFVPNASGIFEGAVVVSTSVDPNDNLIVDLPNSAVALNSGRSFVGINASQGSTVVSSSSLPDDIQITVQLAGIAKAALKANTACQMWSPAGYNPADGGYVVPHVDGTTVQIGYFTQSKSSSSSSQKVGVWLTRGGGLGEQLVGAITASSDPVSNTTSETPFDQSVMVPANLLSVGSVLRIDAKVSVPSGNSTDTLTLKLKLGSQVLVTSPAVDVTNGGGDCGVLSAIVTVRSIGSSGSLTANSQVGLGVPGTATMRVGGVAGAFTLDTTAAQAVTVTATWSAMSASDQAVLEDLVVTLVRASA